MISLSEHSVIRFAPLWCGSLFVSAFVSMLALAFVPIRYEFVLMLTSCMYVVITILASHLLELSVRHDLIRYNTKQTPLIGIVFAFAMAALWLVAYFTGTLVKHVYLFFAVTVCAPIVEELFFRGLLFSVLKTKYSYWVSAVVVSILFASMHWYLPQMFATFGLSLLLFLLIESGCSLIECMLAHSVWNLVSFLALFEVVSHGFYVGFALLFVLSIFAWRYYAGCMQ